MLRRFGRKKRVRRLVVRRLWIIFRVQSVTADNLENLLVIHCLMVFQEWLGAICGLVLHPQTERIDNLDGLVFAGNIEF